METLTLNNNTIDKLAKKVSVLYIEHGATRKEALRARLLLEEALIKYQQAFGEDVEVSFRIYKILTQTRFSLKIKSPSLDPFVADDDMGMFIVQSIISDFDGSAPTWHFRNQANEIVFTLRKKQEKSSIFIITMAVLLAIGLGTIVRLVLPKGVAGSFTMDYVTPLADAYAGMFCVMAVLMTFFAIALGIVRIGDLSTLGSLGGKLVRDFNLMTFLPIIIMIVPLLPMVTFTDHSNAAVQVKTLYDLLIGFLPSNLAGAFLDFNSMHIMIIGGMFGFSLLAMGSKGDTLVEIFDECNLVTVLTNNFLNKFIFVYAFLKAFEIVTTSDFGVLKNSIRMVVVILLAELLLFMYFGYKGSRACDMTFREYFHAMSPPFIICLSSASLGAATTSLFDAMNARGATEEVVNLGANLGSIIFQPACACMFALSSLFMAMSYNVEISVGWLVMLVIMSTLLVAAVPNIPGATVGVITLLFSQLGLPADAITLMIAINALLQFPTVAVDGWCLECEIVIFDKRYGDRIQSMIGDSDEAEL